jgi:hypothetical protein
MEINSAINMLIHSEERKIHFRESRKDVLSPTQCRSFSQVLEAIRSGKKDITLYQPCRISHRLLCLHVTVLTHQTVCVLEDITGYLEPDQLLSEFYYLIEELFNIEYIESIFFGRKLEVKNVQAMLIADEDEKDNKRAIPELFDSFSFDYIQAVINNH